MRIEIEVSEANEGTSAPWWMIVDPRQNFRTDKEASHNIASMITGPFFSREEAEKVLSGQRYNFGAGAVVYCASGHNATQYASKKRWVALAAVAIAVLSGCARSGGLQSPAGYDWQDAFRGESLAAPAPILRMAMWSSLFCDVGDPEWRLKMKALHDMNVNGASALFLICRPKFCEYPWVAVAGQQGSSDATYNLMEMNPRWMAHVNEVVDYANSMEPPFALQFDFLPHPTLRQGEGMVFKAIRMLMAPVGVMEPDTGDPRDEMVFGMRSNVQGIKANGTRLFEDAPTGAWAEVSRNLLRQTVPIINRARFGAVLFVLERNGSEACERWYWNEATAAGLSPSVYVITNARMSGAIHSPHPHSVSAVRSTGNSYISSDGWEPNAGQWRQCVDFKASRWAPAIELYRTEFSDGQGGGDYSKRTRPSAGYIARTCGAVLEQAGR